MSELLIAILEVGLPVTALTLAVFYRLYSRGHLARDADHKTMKRDFRDNGKAEKESKETSDSVLHTKWMKFGGGFYGVAAAWTLIYIRSERHHRCRSPSVGLEDEIDKGLVNSSPVRSPVRSLICRCGNIVLWWPGKGHGPVLWFVVAYVAYMAGLNLARYETGFWAVGLSSSRFACTMAFFGSVP